MTGTRADFGKLKSLIDITEKSNEFECFIFVTGMHTLSKYGSTFCEVQKNGYKNIFVFMNQTHTTDPEIILSNTITGFSNFVKEVQPDMIIVHGDRLESLAGAIVGSFNNILTAHVEGGELSGTLDEIIRHSITKLSHIHFVSNKKAKLRLIQLGELESTIFVIGSPDIDIMMNKNLPSLESVKNHYEIPFTDYGILMFHPVTTELDSLENQIKEIVSAVLESGKNFIVIYPNNDTGSTIILNQYQKLKENKKIKIFPSMRFENFLTLLKNADFIIGNSSAGIREAGIYGIPSIDIGTRQQNRSKNQNIIHVDSKKDLILSAIKKAKNIDPQLNYEFGEGGSNKKFFELLKNSNIWKIRIQKQFIDL